jgi:ABC-type transport system involved in multi-copper enzyme maturation permease subunit
VKAYELIMETFRRRANIRLVHLSWFGTYALLFLIPMPPEAWLWGAFLFAWSGCLLPLLLSDGIFGDDIASGRIRLLVTEPIRTWELYLYRFLGLSLQAAVHLWLAGALILLLQRLTGHGSADHFAVWMLASWLLFNVWAALSTSLSVVLRRSHNSMFLFIITAGFFLVASFLIAFFPENPGTRAYLAALRYTGPPVELLSKMGLGKAGLCGSVASVAHSLLLTALYGAAGIVLLSRREFKYVAD